MTGPSALLYDTYYHIYNRGINRENIFVQEQNYLHFMNLYTKYIGPLAETFAYCLLRNHFHVLLKIKSREEISQGCQAQVVTRDGGSHLGKAAGHPEQTPSKRFSDFFNAYSKSINAAYGRTGSLFQHPFGRIPVTNDRQFWNVVVYIHQNPQKHKFVDDFRDWPWSSYGLILPEKSTSIKRETVLDWFGGGQNYQDLHGHWINAAESLWFAEDDDD